MEVLEWYRLYLNWEGVFYTGDVATFKLAWFDGPVLSDAARILPNDYLQLDFTRQNDDVPIFLTEHFFIAELAWKEVEYLGDRVYLKDCTLSHNKAGTLKELKDGFRILIDCSSHEEYQHYQFLLYPAWVLNPEEEIKK